jgi:xanthine dehydrogenase small subunit
MPVDDVLAGNLCRCTGYGPIVRAVNDLGRADPDPDVADRLAAFDDGRPFALEHAGWRFLAPRTVEGLAEALFADPDATVLAGATDVGVWVTKQLRRLDSVVWLGRIDDLARIEEDEGAIRIGAGATWRDALPVLGRLWPDFGEVLRRFGGVQVRNAATVGGNVANGSPIGDSMPCLIALGAEVLLRRGRERRRLPLEELYLAYGVQAREPGEFVEGVVVPKPEAGDLFRAYKISKRFDQDISAVCAALRLRFDKDVVADARLAFGGMAPTPKRAATAEAALIGRRWDEEAAQTAATALADDFSPIDDMRASGGYRLAVARNLLRRAALDSAAPAGPTRLVGVGALDV